MRTIALTHRILTAEIIRHLLLCSFTYLFCAGVVPISSRSKKYLNTSFLQILPLESHLVKSPHLAKKPVLTGQKIKYDLEVFPDVSWRDEDLVSQWVIPETIEIIPFTHIHPTYRPYSVLFSPHLLIGSYVQRAGGSLLLPQTSRDYSAPPVVVISCRAHQGSHLPEL